MIPEQIVASAHELGFELVGICGVEPPATLGAYEQWLYAGMHGEMGYLVEHLAPKESLDNLLPDVKSVIAVGLNYNQPVSYEPGKPRIARYALGRDYHKVLRSKLNKLAVMVEGPSRICIDSAPLLEREMAMRAGLGWFGKNTMLINSKRGSWFVLGFLLTTLELEPDTPAVGGCGTCRSCIDACPTGAIVQLDGRWQVDARKCISYLTIEHKGDFTPEQEASIGEWTFGCDVCQHVCPFNTERESQPERAPKSSVEDFLQVRRYPALEQLAQIAHSEWDSLTAGTAVRRAGYEGLKRNARANLKNLR